MPGLQEMIVIAVVALLVFGPDRLPEVARNVGRFVGRLRSETERNMGELRNMTEIQDLQRELQHLRRDLQGTAQEFRNPATSGSRTTGSTHRMVDASQDQGRPRVVDEPVPSRGQRPDDAPPPPTDPDAT